jgi:type VI secretion system protein ImpH
MAAQSRGADSDLRQELLQRGFRFDFFQAVRLLARVYPERQAIGDSASPSKEVVRFRAHQSLAFPPSAIAEIRQARDERRPAEMTVAFMGLTGASRSSSALLHRTYVGAAAGEGPDASRFL